MGALFLVSTRGYPQLNLTNAPAPPCHSGFGRVSGRHDSVRVDRRAGIERTPGARGRMNIGPPGEGKYQKTDCEHGAG